MFYNETESDGTDMEYAVLFSGKQEKKKVFPFSLFRGGELIPWINTKSHYYFFLRKGMLSE